MTSKQKKRLTLLAAIVVGVVVLGGGLVAFRMQQLAAREQNLRSEGLELVREGNYREALSPLGRYVNKNKQDTEAIQAFVDARLAVEELGNTHLDPAIAALQMLLRADPDHTEAKLQLVDLYDRRGFSTEVLNLLDRLDPQDADANDLLQWRLRALLRLREHSDVLEIANAALGPDASDEKRAIALRHKTRALAATQRFDQATETALQLTDLRPHDFEAQSLAVDLLWSHEGPDAALEQAVAAAEANPEAPSFELLRSMVHARRDEPEDARKWALQAADREIQEPRLAQRLSSHLEQLRLYQRAAAVLDDAIEKHPDNLPLRGQLAWQLFTAGRHEQAADRLSTLEPKKAGVPAKLLIHRAVSLIRAGATEPAGTLVDAIEEHRSGDTVEAWVPVLRGMLKEEVQDVPAAAEAVSHALSTDEDPVLLELMGRIREAQGENELAIAAYRDAIEKAPAWPEPMERLAEVLMDTDRSRAALPIAQRLLQLTRKRPAVLITALDVAAANRDRISEPQRDRLIDFGLRAWQASPGVPSMVVSLMELLAASDRRDEAATLAASALETPDRFTPRQLARMANAAEALDLDAADNFRDDFEQTRLGTPGDLLSRAMTRHREGDTQAGWELLEQELQRAPDDARQAVRLAMAIYREQTGTGSPADIYRRLLETSGNNTRIARRIVRSDAAAADPELLDAAVEKLRETGGEDGLEWRIGRARYLLQHGEPPRSVNRAIALLDEVINRAPMDPTARMMLADAHRRRGNTAAAVEQLLQAAEVAPDPVAPRLTAAAILIEQGDTARGLATLRSAAASSELSPDQLRRVASLFQNAGQPGEALDTLEAAVQRGRLTPGLPLAQLRWQTGDLDGARDVFETLMNNNVSLPVIERYAQFLRQRGEAEQAAAVLDRLDDVDTAAGVAPLLRGNHQRALGNPDRARQRYREAATANPALEPAWQALVFDQLNRARFDAALDVAAEAAAAMPDSPAYRFLTDNRERLLAHVEAPGMVRSLADVLRQPAKRGALAEALDPLDALADNQNDEPNDNEGDAQALDQLKRLADRHTRDYGLQLLCSHALRAAGRPLAAAEIAQRTARLFTDEAEPAWLAAQALSDAGRWADALAASEQWRDRSNADPLAADYAIAQARLELGDATLATAAIESYLEVARQDPERYGPILALAARARLAEGDVDAARELLEPLVQRDQQWLSRWIGMSFAAPPNASAARRWLESAAPYVASPRERLAYGFGWKSAADRFGDPALYQRATDQLQRVLDATGSDDEARLRAHLLLAFIHDVRNRKREAEDHYRAVLEQDPDNLQARNNLAVLLTESGGDPAEALRLARAAVEGQRDNPTLLDTLAAAQHHAGRVDDAAATMQRVLELDPGNPEWQVRLAEIRLAQGRADEAADLADQALRTLEARDPAQPSTQLILMEKIKERARSVQRETRPEAAQAS